MTSFIGRVASHRHVTGGLAAITVGYVVLGLFDGSLGVAWSDVRADFDRPVSDLPWMWVPHSTGYLVASIISGRMVERLQPRRVIAIGAAISTCSLAAVVVAPSLLAVSATFLALGLGNGLLDSAGNTYVTLAHGPRAMHTLHSAYGVGATIGPLMAATVVGLGWSWRTTYAVLAVVEGIALVAMIRLRRARGSDAVPAHVADPRVRFAAPLVLAAFAFYVALEVSFGQWTYSVLVDERSVSAGVAGVSVAGYWGALLFGRVVLAVLDRRVAPWPSLMTSSAALVLGTTWFAVDPFGTGVVAGVLVGLGAAAVFPTMVLVTPALVGTDRVASLVGFQFGAASLGAIISPILIGASTAAWGLEVTGTWFVGLALTYVVVIGLLFSQAVRVGAAAPLRSTVE